MVALAAAGIMWSMAAGAQTAAPAAENPLCQLLAETIVTPYTQDYGVVPTVWDATYHPINTSVQFGAGVTLENGTVLAWGRRMEPKAFRPGETMLVELNRRGRALAMKAKPARNAEEPDGLLRLDAKGYVASSNMRAGKNAARRQVRLSWYDAALDYKAEKILSDGTFDYVAHGLIPARDGAGFILIVQAVNHRNENDQNAVLMRFARDGKMLWRRAYRPGTPNMLGGLSPLPDGTYLATGRIRTEDGRMAGWAMKLAADGTIMWQRTYQRGAFATLAHGAFLPHMVPGSNILLLAGEAHAADGTTDASWIMATDPGGEPLWQRYVRRDDYQFSTMGLRAEEDGRIVLGVNAAAVPGETAGAARRDHVRLFTLSTLGVLIGDEAYIDGLGATGVGLLRGKNGERIVVGTIRSDARPTTPSQQLAEALKKDETAPENQPPPPKPEEIEEEGWVFVATALDEYDDPCAKTRK